MTDRTNTEAAGDTLGRPARPPGYWQRIEAIVAQAPPLSDHQRAVIRTAFSHSTMSIREAA